MPGWGKGPLEGNNPNEGERNELVDPSAQQALAPRTASRLSHSSGKDLIVRWDRYRQRWISSKVYRNSILQIQDLRLIKGYCWNLGRQLLKSR